MALLDPGVRVYAIGDVHGRLDLLERLHDQIAAEIAASPAERTVIVHLGDYVDRGPDTAGVVERLIGLTIGAAEIVCLKGNHEDKLLTFLADGEGVESFFRYGGREAMASYGIDAAHLGGDGDARHAAAAFAARMPARHRTFLETLPHSLIIGGYFFCHAGIRPHVPLDRQTPHDLMWIREPFLSSAADHGKVVVHGHTPVDDVESLPNRINVDTGAGFGRRLSAAVLEGDRRRFLSAAASR